MATCTLTDKERTKEQMIRLMAHRRAIVALATAHGWDTRVQQSLRHVSHRIHLSIRRIRVGA
jgi:hypothetical protein